MKFTLKDLEETSKKKPQGYKEEVLSLCEREGDTLSLSDENYKILSLKYREPSVFEKTENVIKALGSFLNNPMARKPEEISKIFTQCRGCEWYVVDQQKCGKCGCLLIIKSKYKSWTCPIGKWF